jgi:hypothetical protein
MLYKKKGGTHETTEGMEQITKQAPDFSAFLSVLSVVKV